MHLNEKGEVVLSPEQAKMVEEGLAELDRGEFVTWDQAREYARRRIGEWLPEAEKSA